MITWVVPFSCDWITMASSLLPAITKDDTVSWIFIFWTRVVVGLLYLVFLLLDSPEVTVRFRLWISMLLNVLINNLNVFCPL